LVELRSVDLLIEALEAAKTQFLSWTLKENGESARSLLVSLWTSFSRSSVILIALIRWILTARMQMVANFYRPSTKTEPSLVAKEDLVEITKRKIFVVCSLLSASETPDQISRDQIPILYQIKTYEAHQVLSALQQTASNLQGTRT